jgi:uncharacterized protein (UPF0216 family)
MANKSIPQESMLFDPVQDTYGSRLALVFGNENKDGKCPFYGKQCYHCDIGAGEGVQFDSEMNKERLSFFRDNYANVLPDIAHLIVYNSGSTLNNREMSRETLEEIAKYSSELEDCKVVSFDTREVYVNQETLDYLVSTLREDQQPRVILGIETQDDHVRTEVLNKKISRKNIERAFENVGRYNGEVGVDVNVVIQPPSIRGEESIQEAVRTAEYAISFGKEYGVPVDLNIHPYYPSKMGLSKFPDHPRATLKETVDAVTAIKELVDRESPESRIFVGLQDEEHDQEQDRRNGELERTQRYFDQFNITQDVSQLRII